MTLPSINADRTNCCVVKGINKEHITSSKHNHIRVPLNRPAETNQSIRCMSFDSTWWTTFHFNIRVLRWLYNYSATPLDILVFHDISHFLKYYYKMSITIKQNKNIRIDFRSRTHSCTGSKTVYFLVIPRESIERCSNIPALASYLNTSQAVFTHIPSCPRSLSALCKLLGSLCSQCSCSERHMEGRIASGVLTASAKNLLIILPIQQVAWPGLDQWVWTTILPHTTEAR